MISTNSKLKIMNVQFNKIWTTKDLLVLFLLLFTIFFKNIILVDKEFNYQVFLDPGLDQLHQTVCNWYLYYGDWRIIFILSSLWFCSSKVLHVEITADHSDLVGFLGACVSGYWQLWGMNALTSWMDLHFVV
jgi:hypothetical protein